MSEADPVRLDMTEVEFQRSETDRRIREHHEAREKKLEAEREKARARGVTFFDREKNYAEWKAQAWNVLMGYATTGTCRVCGSLTIKIYCCTNCGHG